VIVLLGIMIIWLSITATPHAPTIAAMNSQFALETFCICILQFLTPIQQGELWNRVFAARDQSSRKEGLTVAFVVSLLIGIVVFLVGTRLGKSDNDIETSLVMLGNDMPWYGLAMLAVATCVFYLNAATPTLFSIGALMCAKESTSESKVTTIRSGVIGITSIALFIIIAVNALSLIPSIYDSLIYIIALGAVPGVTFMVTAFARPREIVLQAMLAAGIAGFVGFAYGVPAELIPNSPVTALIPAAMTFGTWLVLRKH
jgi:hypothetical protein